MSLFVAFVQGCSYGIMISNSYDVFVVRFLQLCACLD